MDNKTKKAIKLLNEKNEKRNKIVWSFILMNYLMFALPKEAVIWLLLRICIFVIYCFYCLKLMKEVRQCDQEIQAILSEKVDPIDS